jgi:methylphosphotriester-DNA--protein-cysteine methyltransferase
MVDRPPPDRLDCRETVLRECPPVWLRSACSYIERNAECLPSVYEVATAVRVSPERLIAGFRRFLGFTPNEFLAEVICRP